MRINIVTLFPDLYEPFKLNGPIRKAIEGNKLEINTTYLKDFGLGKHSQVDDTPYGGGAGMLLMVEPLHKAIKFAKTRKSKVVLISPDGETFNQKKAIELSKLKDIVFVSGYYEGFDERIKDYIDDEISIGDFIVSRGDIPIIAILDSIVRLNKGVINSKSLEDESFNNNLLEYPQYTNPRVYKKKSVPEVLISGNHKKIAEFNKDQAIKKTKEKRKDLYNRYKEKSNGSK